MSQTKLMTIQPFFVMGSDDFCQRVLLENGISHFFSFSNKSGVDIAVPLFVDGCRNIIFEYKNKSLRTHLVGSTLKTRTFSVRRDCEYFGVRLQPCSSFCTDLFPVKETAGNVIILDDVPGLKDFCRLMEMQEDFDSRIKTFLSEYPRLCGNENDKNCKKLSTQISDLIIERRGMVKVCELEKLSGYTSRYINKIFDKELGLSAKQLCGTVKFHFLLDDMNNGNMESLTAVSSQYDFYDQSHFIREFKDFTGFTPSKYIESIEEKRYIEHVRNL